MKKPLQIGITGGIGAGKSLVTKIFHILGIPVYDADTRARQLMNTDQVLIAHIKKNFGAEAYLEDGTLNRKLISSVAFSSHEKIEILNSLVHPQVAIDYDTWYSRQKNSAYTLKEAALLIESKSYEPLDAIIVVTAPERLRIKRVLLRDPQRTEKDIQRIIANQLPEKEKTSRADFTIVNDETSMVIPQVLKLNALLNQKFHQQL